MGEKTRCKFKCDSVTAFAWGSKQVCLSPVVSGSDENKSFWQYTPSGKLEFNCVNDAVKFIPGEEYYIDISLAPKV